MFEDEYVDPFDELVALHTRCNILEGRYNELATSHNMLMNQVELHDRTMKVLVEAMQVLQNSQIYLLEDDSETN